MVIFLLPVAIDTVHDHLNHEHNVCTSKVDTHIHKKDIDCDLHLLKQANSFLVTNNFKLPLSEFIAENNFSEYNFLKNHLQLSFSLRGPPALI